MRLESKSLQCRYAQPGRKLSIADNNTVCESCDSYGHFARYCPHRKPNADAAQNKRDAIWAEKNSVQASDLQEINKLIMEDERLRAMADTASMAVSFAEDCGSEDDSRAVNSVQARELQEINKMIKEAQAKKLRAMADTAGIAVSDAEDCGSEDDSRSTKGAAVNHSRSSLSKSKTSPSKSSLLAATVPHSCVPHTHAKIVTRKKVHFPRVLSSAPRLDPHIDCSFLSCSCSKCNSFKNSKGLWLVYSQTTASCQQRAGCKCDQCRKFYILSGVKWNEVSASHSFSHVHLTEHFGAAPVCVLLCFIDPRVRKIRNEASSCPGIFSRTLRFYYVASSPGSPLPHLLDGHRKLVGRSAIPARSCPGPVQSRALYRPIQLYISPQPSI